MRERLALLREYLKNRLAFGKNKKTRKGLYSLWWHLLKYLPYRLCPFRLGLKLFQQSQLKLRATKIDNYVYTNADIGSDNGYSGKTIDLTKYFRAAGGVHLASASSADGENIFSR